MIRSIGNKGLEFGSAEEIAAKHPGDRIWGSPNGEIGDAVTLLDGTECISVFIGQGDAVIITADGRCLGGDRLSECPRVKDGAWIPRVLYDEAERNYSR